MSRRPSRLRSAATVAGWLVGLAAGAAALGVAGRTLPLPDGLAPDRLVLWTAEVGPVTAGFTAARAVAGLLLGWLALSWCVAVAVRLLRLTAATRATDALTLPSVRRLADLVAGAAVVAVSLVPATHAGAVGTDPSPLVVMHDLGPTPGAATTTSSTTSPPPTSPSPSTSTTTTTTLVTVTPPPSNPADATGPDAGAGPMASSQGMGPSMAASPGTHHSGTWRIAPGDTLWDIADATASDRLGRPASGAEIVGQLDRLLDLNADRLAVPGDADLVFPGQEFLLPDP